MPGGGKRSVYVLKPVGCTVQNPQLLLEQAGSGYFNLAHFRLSAFSVRRSTNLLLQCSSLRFGFAEPKCSRFVISVHNRYGTKIIWGIQIFFCNPDMTNPANFTRLLFDLTYLDQNIHGILLCWYVCSLSVW